MSMVLTHSPCIEDDEKDDGEEDAWFLSDV
jgi:hypothetical protein